MVNYTCQRCGFSTYHKSVFGKHLLRKNICPLKLNDFNSDHLLKINNFEKELKNKKKCKNSNILSNDEIFVKDDKLVCRYCNNMFNNKDDLELHLKKKCKMMVEFNNIYIFDKKTFGKNIYNSGKKSGDIYIIQTDYINNDHYKIGITCDIRRRLSQYKCGSTYEPRLIGYFPCEDINFIDSYLNEGLVEFNIKREIFKGDLEIIKNKITIILKNKFKLNNNLFFEPKIKLGDLTECTYCKKFFYTKNALFEHYKECIEYNNCKFKDNNLNKKICQYCKKEFSRSDSLKRHIDKRCKVKNNTYNQLNNKIDILMNEINSLKEERVRMKKYIQENIKNIKT